MKVLITGANGFTGTYLVKYLQQHSGLRLYCLTRSENQGYDYACDLTNYESVNRLIQKIRPDQIYHLAGSFTNDYQTDYGNNVLSSKNILDSIIENKLACRVLLVGSSSEYGFVKDQDNPIKEDYPLNPVSIYGLTKVYQTSLMKFYYQVHKLDIVMARTFNLLGENMSNKLFIGRIYQQIEQYKKGEIEKITLGSLESKRDYLNVEQAIKNYHTVMNYGKNGEVYNVGSGESVILYDLLEQVLVSKDLDLSIIETKSRSIMNKLNVNNIVADISKIRALSTGSIPLSRK